MDSVIYQISRQKSKSTVKVKNSQSVHKDRPEVAACQNSDAAGHVTKDKRKAPVVNEELLAEYREAFGLYDRNGDGLITSKELGALLRSLGQNPTESELRDLIYSGNINKSGSLDFNEFLRMMSKRHDHMEEEMRDIIDAFRVFDRDRDGYISAVELRQAMVTLGERLSAVEVDTMIKAADIDGDEKIDYVDFVRAMSQR